MEISLEHWRRLPDNLIPLTKNTWCTENLLQIESYLEVGIAVMFLLEANIKWSEESEMECPASVVMVV